MALDQSHKSLVAFFLAALFAWLFAFGFFEKDLIGPVAEVALSNHDLDITPRRNNTIRENAHGTERLSKADYLLGNLTKRQFPRLTDEQFQTFVCKGDQLLMLTSLTKEEATARLGRSSESSFSEYTNIGRWGWETLQLSLELPRESNMRPPLRGLSMDVTTPPNIFISHKHVMSWEDSTGVSHQVLQAHTPLLFEYLVDTFNMLL